MPKITTRSLYYDDTMVVNVALFGNASEGGYWKKDAYRTVTFLEPPTGDLLEFLQLHAKKQ